MTEDDLQVLVAAITPVIRDAVHGLDLRVLALEARPLPTNGVDGAAGPRGEMGPTGAAGTPGERGAEGPEGKSGRDGRDGLPGVPGPPGEKGANGLHGKDGIDGLGFGDLVVEHDGERGFAIKAIQGERVKTCGAFTVPAQINRGVYSDGKTYDRGDVVTWGGSQWHCNDTTTSKPGDGAKAWTLIVKRGRDGKDGVDAPGALPVVKVR